MEALTDIDSPGQEVRSCLVDVVDRELEAFESAGRRVGQPLAENDRAGGTRRGELHDSVVLVLCQIGIEPPPEGCIEVLCAVDICNGHDHDFKSQLALPDRLGATHLRLHSLVIS